MLVLCRFIDCFISSLYIYYYYFFLLFILFFYFIILEVNCKILKKKILFINFKSNLNYLIFLNN